MSLFVDVAIPYFMPILKSTCNLYATRKLTKRDGYNQIFASFFSSSIMLFSFRQTSQRTLFHPDFLRCCSIIYFPSAPDRFPMKPPVQLSKHRSSSAPFGISAVVLCVSVTGFHCISVFSISTHRVPVGICATASCV